MPKPTASSYRLYGANQTGHSPFEANSPAGFSLPDLLTFNSGLPVSNAAQWQSRRPEVAQHILTLAYGELPATLQRAVAVVLHSATVHQFAGARLLTVRVEADSRQVFLMRVFVPALPGRLPVVLNGDACWHYATDEVIAEVLRRGYVFAQFNRVEIALDVAADVAVQGDSGPRQPVLHRAIASWAWGYHRAVDALVTCDFVDADAIAIVGHSRGGKAAVLAGATDSRIAFTSANNSGAGGAGCFRAHNPGAETLADLLTQFPHWLNPALKDFVGRENALPFDQHFLKALIAPRALLTTEALGDLWANPAGTWQTHSAAKKVYELLKAGDKIAVAYREGGHAHKFADWCCFLDFADKLLKALPARPPRSTARTRSPDRA